MENKSCVVMGEASESDEENILMSVVSRKLNKYFTMMYIDWLMNFQDIPPFEAEQKSGVVQGVIVAGEATESEEESEESYSEASEAFYSRSGATRNNVDMMVEGTTVVIPKYNTLLHKKLRERNASLRRTVCEFSRQCLTNASCMLNTTNQQLLSSQVELQDAATGLHRSINNLNKIDASLETILLTSFLPTINIIG